MGEQPAERRCDKRVYDRGVLSGSRCRLPVAVEVKGRWFCKRHDPKAVKLERDALDTKRHEQWLREESARSRRAAIHEAERRVIEAAKAWRRSIVDTGAEDELAAAVRALEEAERA